MATIKANETGFWATDHEIYYRTPGGTVWFSSDDFDGIRTASEIPAEAIAADKLMTPQEMDRFIRDVEEASGERVVEAERGKVVSVCTWRWFDVARELGEIELSADTETWLEWDEGARLYEQETGVPIPVDLDPEAWILTVERVAEKHSAIRPGDFAVCAGYGADVVFFRLRPEADDAD